MGWVSKVFRADGRHVDGVAYRTLDSAKRRARRFVGKYHRIELHPDGGRSGKRGFWCWDKEARAWVFQPGIEDDSQAELF